LLISFAKIAPEARNDFVFLLKQLDPHAADSLRRDVKDPEVENRIGRMQLLCMLDSPESSIKIMSTLAWDNDIKIRATAVKLLGRPIDTKDLSKIIRFLYDTDNRVIANTIETLEEIGNQNILGILLRFRKHANNRVRANALKALWNLGYREIYADILGMLQDPSELMRASATWLIGQVGHGAVELVKLLDIVVRDQSPMVKSNLVRSANTIGSPEARDILSKIKTDDVKKINTHARHRLHEMSLEKDPRTRATAVKILGPLLDPRDLAKILAFLEDPNDRVVANTVEILEAIGGLRVLEFIQKQRKHRNNRVRANALRALWRYGIRDIGDDIEIMLRDSKDLMRASAVWLIGEIGRGESRIRNLLKIVEKDRSEMVRRNIRRARSKLGLDKSKSPARDLEELAIQFVQVLLNDHMIITDENCAVSRNMLIAELKETILEPGGIDGVIDNLIRRKLLAGAHGEKHDEAHGDLLLVPDPEALDLFLDYRQDPVAGRTALWGRFAGRTARILDDLESLTGTFGRKTEAGGVLKTKFLFPEVNSDNYALDMLINELEGSRAVSIVEEENERAIAFQSDTIRKAQKARLWLTRFI